MLNDWFRNRRFLFVLVTGGPGSGKTHAVVETLDLLDLRVVKMAYTGRHAHRIGGQTVHRTMRLSTDERRKKRMDDIWDRLAEIENPEECMRLADEMLPRDGGGDLQCLYPAADAVVVDEVGMLPFWLVQRITAYFRDRYPEEQRGLLRQKREIRPVVLFCMGDDCQLRPVRSRLNLFDVPDFERWWMGEDGCGVPCETRRARMTESQRFTPEYDRIVSRLRELMEGGGGTDKEEEEEAAVMDHPLFQFIRETFPVVLCITQDMMWRARVVLSFTNDTIDACNLFYLEKKMAGEEEHLIPSEHEQPKKLRRNCRVVVTENGCGAGCYNGSRLIFLNYDRANDEAVCLDERTMRETRVRRSRYSNGIPLVPGFAVTIHKFQGETIDEDGIVLSFDNSKDLNLIYTALSRVRDLSQIVAVVF